jgi:hypothetical protein
MMWVRAGYVRWTCVGTYIPTTLIGDVPADGYVRRGYAPPGGSACWRAHAPQPPKPTRRSRNSCSRDEHHREEVGDGNPREEDR